jgi:hypothetical protein
MRTAAIILLVFGALIGCQKKEGPHADAVAITRLTILQTQMLTDYYSGEKARAEKALVAYLAITTPSKLVVTTEDGRRMLYESRAINMARLAFLRASAVSEPNLTPAVSEMRLSDVNTNLSEPVLVKALQEIVGGDPVPWVRKKQ